MGWRMGEYRVYKLGCDGKIVSPHDVVAADDSEAVTRATELRGQFGCEIWERKRLVGRMPGSSDQA